MVLQQQKMSREELAAYNARIAEENSMYWYCRGKRGKDPDDFYVAWDGPTCENNGWYHWKCIEELKYKSKEEVEKESEWYCPSCISKKAEIVTPPEPEPTPKPEGKFILLLIMLTYFFVMKILWAQRFNSGN